MAIGRITGSVLKSNLTRNGVDLAFETNLLYLDVTNSRVGIGTSEPSTTLHVNGTLTTTALAVSGSTATVDSKEIITGKSEGTNFTGSLLVGHATSGTLSSAIRNTGVGIVALDAITSGTNNTAVGYNAGTTITTGSSNTAIGSTALVTTNGDNNTAIGHLAMRDATSGEKNTVVGSQAGLTMSGGSADYNTLIGHQAGDNISSGAGNVVIGGADVDSATGSRQLVIAGNDGSTTTTWIKGSSTGAVTLSGAITFPTSDGSAGQVLQTDGSGNISFGTVSTDSLATGGITIDDNKITGQRSNENIEIGASGSGIIETSSSILPATDNAVDLGSSSKRFKDIYASSGTIHVGDQTIKSTASGFVFSGAVSTTASTTISDDTTASLLQKTGIGSTEEKTIESNSTAQFDSALYYITSRDEINDQVAVQKVSVIHNNSNGYASTSHVTKTGTTTGQTFNGDVSGGSVRLRATGHSASNSVTAYSIQLGDYSSVGTSGNTAIVINSDVDSSSESLDTWAHASYRGAKYFISVNDEVEDELESIECLVVHDGTTAYITDYNSVRTGSNSLITLTATLGGSNVTLSGSGARANLNVKMHRILLSDSETGFEATNQKIIPATTVSSTATTIDQFDASAIHGAFYYVVGTSSNESNASSITELAVATDGTDAYITTGPMVSTKGTDQLTFTATISGSTVTIQASSTSGSSTTVNAYRINMKREESVSAASTVNIGGTQTISGAKTFSANVTLNDDVKLKLGTGGDLEIYHDGLNSYIDDAGTGSIFIRSGTTYFQNAAGTKTSIQTNAGSGQTLYFNNNQKFQTTNTGIGLTGVMRMAVESGDPSTVSNSAHIYAKDDSSSAEVFVQDEAGNVTKISPHNEKGEWEYFSRNTKTGKTVRVNMEEMIRDIEKLTGKSYIKDE